MTAAALILDWMSVYGWIIAAALLVTTAVRDHFAPALVADRRSYRRLLREDRARRAATPRAAARHQLPVGTGDAPAAVPTGPHPFPPGRAPCR